MLKDNGKIFLTVAVWAGAVDHIYLYHNANEVRDQIKQSGFKIINEKLQTILERDKNNLKKNRIPLMYLAILSK